MRSLVDNRRKMEPTAQDWKLGQLLQAAQDWKLGQPTAQDWKLRGTVRYAGIPVPAGTVTVRLDNNERIAVKP